MPARKRERDGEQHQGPQSVGDTSPADQATSRLARVLCVDADSDARDAASRLLSDLPVEFAAVASTHDARDLLTQRGFDVLIVDTAAATGDSFDLVREQADVEMPLQAIMVSRRPTVDLSVRAMRVGAIDILRKPFDPEEFVNRLDAAVERADLVRHSKRRVDRLKRICKRLNEAREEVTREVDILCSDLVGAYQDLADQVAGASVASEFSGLIRRELDVEALLRCSLEFILTKTGPTNAAVFLPTGIEDFSLGAYVNYDMSKDTVDVLLDHLADILAPRFEDQEQIVSMWGRDQITRWIDDSAEWLSDSALLVFPCHHDGECLAVVALFRDASKPFKDDLIQSLDVIRALFAEQLARVIRIHNRHRGTELWTGFDVDTGHDDEESGGFDCGDCDADFPDDYDIAA